MRGPTRSGVAGNVLVTLDQFAPYTIDRIRINITDALASSSRITEVEAWGSDAAP